MHIFYFTLTGEISNHECTVSCSITVLPATSMPLMSTLRRNEHSTAFTENLILTEKPEKIPNYFPNLFRLLIGFLLQWRDIREKVSTRLYMSGLCLPFFPILQLWQNEVQVGLRGSKQSSQFRISKSTPMIQNVRTVLSKWFWYVPTESEKGNRDLASLFHTTKTTFRLIRKTRMISDSVYLDILSLLSFLSK